MRNYLAFVGSPATYGTPHPRTGRYNYHGKLFLFNSKKERDEFCDNFDHQFNAYPYAIGKREAKSKCFAGMSQQAFEEQFAALASGIIEWM